MSIFKDNVLLITGGTGSFGYAVMKRYLPSVSSIIGSLYGSIL